MSKRDLGTRENVSSRMNAMQLFILFHNKASLAYRLVEMFFFGNRDNFCPYEQALKDFRSVYVTHLSINGTEINFSPYVFQIALQLIVRYWRDVRPIINYQG